MYLNEMRNTGRLIDRWLYHTAWEALLIVGERHWQKLPTVNTLRLRRAYLTLASEKKQYMLHRWLSGLRNEAISRPSCIPRAVRPLFPLQDTSTVQSRESSAHRRRRGCTSLSLLLLLLSLSLSLFLSLLPPTHCSRTMVDPRRCENNAWF